MTVRYAVRILALALPLYAGGPATSAFSDPFDDQVGGANVNASVPSMSSEPATTAAGVSSPPAMPPGPTVEQRPSGLNPLWGMPVKQFSITRERPIFLPSRRPPAPPPPVAKVVVPPPRPKEPEQPQLSLVGTIASDEDKFGIFVDTATKAVLRLRVGEDFQGWKLQSVKGREVAFQKNQQSFVVALPQPALTQPVVVVREEASQVNTRQRPGLK